MSAVTTPIMKTFKITPKKAKAAPAPEPKTPAKGVFGTTGRLAETAFAAEAEKNRETESMEASEDKTERRRVLGKGRAYGGRARKARSVIGDPATIQRKTLLGG